MMLNQNNQNLPSNLILSPSSINGNLSELRMIFGSGAGSAVAGARDE